MHSRQKSSDFVHVRSTTPGPQSNPRSTFTHPSKHIHCPSVRFECEIFKTNATEPSEPRVIKFIKVTKGAKKVEKFIPTVNLLNGFALQSSKKPSLARAKPTRTKSTTSGKQENCSNMRISSKDHNEIFKIFSLTPKKIIANLQASQQYVRKNKLSRERIILHSVNLSSATRYY